MARQRKLTAKNWQQSSKLILLQLHKKLLKNWTLAILQPFGIWNKLERWKSLINRCLMSWPHIKKIVISKSCLPLLYTTKKNHFSNQIVTCDKKWIFYNNWQCPAQWLGPKHFPKLAYSNIQGKEMGQLWGRKPVTHTLLGFNTTYLILTYPTDWLTVEKY